MQTAKTRQLQPLSIGNIKTMLSSSWWDGVSPITGINTSPAKAEATMEIAKSSFAKKIAVSKPNSKRMSSYLSTSTVMIKSRGKLPSARQLKERLYRSIIIDEPKTVENIQPSQGLSLQKAKSPSKFEQVSSPTKELKEFEMDFGFYMNTDVLKDSDLFKDSAINTPQVRAAEVGRKISQLNSLVLPNQQAKPLDITTSMLTPTSRRSAATVRKTSGISTLQKLIQGVQLLKVVNQTPKRSSAKICPKTTKSLKAVLSSSTHGTEADLTSAHAVELKKKAKTRFQIQRSPCTASLTSAQDLIASTIRVNRRNSSIEYQTNCQ